MAGNVGIGVTARSILARNLEVIRHCEPGMRVGFHDEAIHDVRVASRRIRTALRTFRDVLPRRAKALRDEAHWLRRQLGNGRDLEVQVERLRGTAESLSAEDRALLERYLDVLVRRFEDGARGILDVVNSSRYAGFVAGLSDVVRSRPKGKVAKRKTEKAAAVILGGEFDRILDGFPRRFENNAACDESMHRLRIQLKRLRYVCEFFAPVGPASLASFIRDVKRFQDILGDHQDCATGIELLVGDASSPEASDRGGCPSELLLAVADTVTEEKRALRERFLEEWPDFRRRRRFGVVIDDLD